MIHAEWVAESGRRIRVSEGQRLYKYLDSVQVTTIGDGWNLERGDSQAVFTRLGIDWAQVVCAPVAIDSAPENAVEPCITEKQAEALFAVAWEPIEADARSSLAPGMFDFMADSRRFVVCDLRYQLGKSGWLDFGETRDLLNRAQAHKNAGALIEAHALFVQACEHLDASLWYKQSGDRAKRNVAMLRSGEWGRADGDGSDLRSQGRP